MESDRVVEQGRSEAVGPRRAGARRWRMLVFGALGGGLLWAIVTHSLVAALVGINPHLALTIKPDDPRALMELAERALEKERARLTKLSKASPSTAPAADTESAEEELPEHDLRTWVTTVLAAEPGNARALSILGDLARKSGAEHTAATLFAASLKRSERDPVALGWRIEEALQRRDWPQAVRTIDTLLRYYHEEAFWQLSPLLVELLQEPEAAPLIWELLGTAPPWRIGFVHTLLNATTDARVPLDLFLALKETPHPPTATELRSYIGFLIDRQFFDLAYYTWLQFLPPDQLARAGLLFNGSFESRPSGMPFDWALAREKSSAATIERRAGHATERALVVRFGQGRAEIDYISQVMRLQPGPYQIQGSAIGDVRGPRGMRWRVRCLGAQRVQIAESAMFIGRIASWTEFSFDVTVPAAGCEAQQLQLVLDARTASEQLVSGSISFDEMSVVRREP